MKVLVACEESQEVCKAFRAKGHEALQACWRLLHLPAMGQHEERLLQIPVPVYFTAPTELVLHGGL